MLSAIDEFYEKQQEPNKSCFLALKQIILSLSEEITPEWKYSLPFFYLKGKMFCYLWKDKKTNQPYIGIMNAGFINHPLLESGDRKRVKIIRIDPLEDIPIKDINFILTKVIKN